MIVQQLRQGPRLSVGFENTKYL
jgi:hypothetical protein